MRKRVVFAPGGRVRRNQRFPRDERGVTPIIGAILVLAFVVLALSIYLSQVVPSYLRHNEIKHMDTVRGVFFDFQRMVFSRENGTLDIPMSPEPTPLFSLPATSSRVEVTQARWVKRFQPVQDTYVSENSPDSTAGGSSEALWIQSYRFENETDNGVNNRRLYIEFNLPEELSGISSRGIEEAWLVLYCENITKFMGQPWENPDNDPTNSVGESEVPTNSVDLSYLPSVPIKVEVRGVSGTWSQDELTWNNQSSLTIGDTIMAMDWPNEDNHTIKENDVWFTWDVTSWVRDRVLDNESASFLLKACYENSTLDRYATFSSRDRQGNLGWSWTEDVEARDNENDNTYPDSHLPQYSMPHLTVIYENGNEPGPPVLDNWGAFIEGGTVRFDTNYREFPSTSFIFESGALLQQQYGFAYEFMISDPGLVVGERLDEDAYGDNIAVYVNRYRIVNWDRLTTSADAKLIVSVQENTDDYVAGIHYPIDEDGDGVLDPNRENVVITVRSSFEWPWKYYLRDQTGTLKGFNVADYEGGLKAYVETPWGDQQRGTADFMSKLYVDRNIRMYIYGREWDPSAKDILYYDRTYDVRVEIGV